MSLSNTNINYKILDTSFCIDKHTLKINGKRFVCKKATIEALQLFLQSNGKVISKDNLIDHIWKDVIVTEASAFKQVQLVRKIFAEVGLPKDIIHNVYGKGYQIKLPIITTQEDCTNPDLETNNKQSDRYYKSTKRYTLVLISLILIISLFVSFYQSPIKNDFFNKAKKESLVKLINNDWRKGKQHLINLLEKESYHLSIKDLAFLYNHIGRSEYHLQEYKNSIETYYKAIQAYEKVDNNEQIGQVHLNLAESYSFIVTQKGYREKQKEHINKAIEIFARIDQKQRMIDAKMQLAYFYQKHVGIQKAKNLYEQIIDDTKQEGDTIGEMIAVNNLAAAYVITNDYDKAVELGQKGLQMTLEIGTGRYIANSYSFLSDLYQNQYKSIEAMEMIQQAIKYQLATNNFSNISPKMITLSYLLVQTYQFDQANDLLNLADNYLISLNMKGSRSIVIMYQGLNLARQNNWKDAENLLTNSLAISQAADFIYKQPLNLAYLALANYFNNNYLQAIQPAMEVIKNKNSNKQSKAIASLALAYTYSLMEKQELADKWYLETQKLQNPKWLFEYQLFLKLKLERQEKDNSVLVTQTEKEIVEINIKMTELTQLARVDQGIYNKLMSQILEKTRSNSKN